MAGKHKSWNLLLEQDGTESGVECTETLGLVDLAESAGKAVGKGRVRDETNAGGLERAEGNVGEELGGGRRSEVDGGTVVGSSLVSEEGDGLLLEELVTTKLEGTLEEVTGESWAGTGQKSASTLIGNDLTETTDEATVVGDGVELDLGLDATGPCAVSRRVRELITPTRPTTAAAAVRAQWRTKNRSVRNLHIDGGKTTVGQRTADGTSKGESGVEIETGWVCWVGSSDGLLDGIQLGGAGRGGRSRHVAGIRDVTE